MKLIALKDISPTWKKDEIMEQPDATGRALIATGAAQEVTESAAPAQDEKRPSGRRVGAQTYQRRDMQAERPSDTKDPS